VVRRVQEKKFDNSEGGSGSVLAEEISKHNECLLGLDNRVLSVHYVGEREGESAG